MECSLSYCPNIVERVKRLHTLYERRVQDQVFACMEVTTLTKKQFAQQYKAGYCEYPDPEKRIHFWNSHLQERIPINDDSVPSAPLKEMDQGLYGGLVGGKVQFMCDPERGKISSMVHPILKNWDEFETLSFNHKCEWFERYLKQLKIFVKGSSGKFGISHLILIDSLNFVFELFGATRTYVDLIEHPEMIEKAIDFAFNLNLQVQRTFFQLVPLIDDGTCSELAEWLPGQIVSESVDPFHMTSVEYFEKWGRDPVERIFDQFDGGILHIHGNGRHLLKAVSTIRGLKAIYLGDDRGFPLAFDVLDNIKKQVGNIPLIVAVNFQKFINALEKHQLGGGVLYRVSEVPDIDSANSCMEKVYGYKV